MLNQILSINPLFAGIVAIAILVLAPIVFRSINVRSIGLVGIGIVLVILVVWQWSTLSHLTSFSQILPVVHTQQATTPHTPVSTTGQEIAQAQRFQAAEVSRQQQTVSQAKPLPRSQQSQSADSSMQAALPAVSLVIGVIAVTLVLLARFGRRRPVTVCGQCHKLTNLREYRYTHGRARITGKLCATCAQEFKAQPVAATSRQAH